MNFAGIKAVDNLIEDCVSVLKVSEEGELLEGHLDESHVFVIVVKDSLSDVLVNLRVLQDDLSEVFVVELANGAVLESDHRSCSQAIVDQGDLTEKLSLTQNFLLLVDSSFSLVGRTAHLLSLAPELGSGLRMKVSVAEVNHTLALGNQVKSCAGLQLLNDHVIRLQKLSLHSLDNRLDDELLSLSHSAFGEGVSLDVVLGDLDDGDSHLQVVLHHF